MPFATDWSSLEIVKLAVAAITPIVVVLVGRWVSKGLKRIEDAQWTDRKLIERRLDVYDRMAEPLNDLYVFFRLRGHFQEITPPEAIKRKRVADRTFYVNKGLMTDEFIAAYHSFMDACFEINFAVARDARLKASPERQREERGRRWRDEWNDLFVDSSSLVTSGEEIDERYEALVDSFAAELGAKRPSSSSQPAAPGTPGPSLRR
jgi:hypothetical protein